MRSLLVHFQSALLDETFPTVVTAEGALTSVYPLVSFKSVSLVEAFATSLTPEWFFPRVYAQVALQVTLYREAFVAVLTVVGPLPGVDHLVHFQAMGSIEALATLFTAEWADISMETLVVPQQLLQCETLPTNITGVRPLTCTLNIMVHTSVDSIIFKAHLINIFNCCN